MVPIMSFNDHDSYHDVFFVQNDSESVTNRFYCQMPSRVIMTRFNCTGRLTNRFYRMTDAVAAATIVFAFLNDQLISYRQSSTRISAALAKATVMRITGTPSLRHSLPAPTFLSHVNLGLSGAFQIYQKWQITHAAWRGEGGRGVDGVKGCSCPVDGPGRRRSGVRRGRASAGPGQLRATIESLNMASTAGKPFPAIYFGIANMKCV